MPLSDTPMRLAETVEVTQPTVSSWPWADAGLTLPLRSVVCEHIAVEQIERRIVDLRREDPA